MKILLFGAMGLGIVFIILFFVFMLKSGGFLFLFSEGAPRSTGAGGRTGPTAPPEPVDKYINSSSTFKGPIGPPYIVGPTEPPPTSTTP